MEQLCGLPELGRGGGLYLVNMEWSSVHKRFMRWSKAGVWQMIFDTLAVDEDTEWKMVDSAVIRAHQRAVGARKKYKEWVRKNRS
ncbi:hypothetical protein MIDIC_70016 [Alphaproteobacteria bacterium]